MHYAGVLLWRADVAGVFESDPRVARFKEHRQHFAPHVGGGHFFAGLNFSTFGFLLIGHIGLFEGGAKQVVQVRHIGRGEQSPVAFFHDAAHEQVGNPVGGVHVVGASAVVAGVLTQL